MNGVHFAAGAKKYFNNDHNNNNNNNNACTFPNPTFAGHPAAATTLQRHSYGTDMALRAKSNRQHRRLVQQSIDRNNYPQTTRSDAPRGDLRSPE
jgi:hypothetical protein